jgi:uncharacterized membrane protein YfcA
VTAAPAHGLRRSPLALVAIGAGAGLLSGLFGVGGGLLMLAAIVPIAVVGALVFGRADSVNVVAAVVLAAGSLLGVQVGTRVMARLSGERLALAFAGFVIVVALAMLFL